MDAVFTISSLAGQTSPFLHCTFYVYLLFNLWGTVHEVMVPELKEWVFDEFDECDEQPPRVWTVHNEPLQQHSVTKKKNQHMDKPGDGQVNRGRE